MRITEKIYEFFSLAGNMVLSAVRYTEVTLTGMQYCIISSQIILSQVYLSFHLNSQNITLCPSLAILLPPLLLWGFAL